MTGGFVICEYKDLLQQSRADGWPTFQGAQMDLETSLINKAQSDWRMTFGGYMGSSEQITRTTILPALFMGWWGTPLNTTWRQNLPVAGHQFLLGGRNVGWTIPEDFMVGWAGLAFVGELMGITELRWQIGDQKYGRVDIEEMRGYNQPALVFEKGFIIDEEEDFTLFGYVEDTGYQYIIPLGFQLNKVKTKVLGNPGQAIT